MIALPLGDVTCCEGAPLLTSPRYGKGRGIKSPSLALRRGGAGVGDLNVPPVA